MGLNLPESVPRGKGGSVKVLLFFLAVLLLTAIDQGTKLWAVRCLRPSGSVPLWPGVFELQYVENTGAAFGLFRNQQILFCLFALIIACAAAVIFHRLPKTRRFVPLRAVCVLLSAGALGNMIDRIAHRYVIDFLYFSLIDFPVFNAADIYVTVSCVLLLVLLLFVYRDEELGGLFRKGK